VTFQPQPNSSQTPGLPGAYQLPSPQAQPSITASLAFLTQAFTWMFAGLLLTAGIAAYVWSSESLRTFAANNILIVLLAQLAIVFIISGGIDRLSATLALGLFFVYAATLGLSVGLIVSLYTGSSVASAFLSAAAMFGGAALYGATTKRSLAGVGAFASSMAIFGIIAAFVVNFFLGSSLVGYVISVAGVVVFTVLTAYDVQRIESGQLVVQTGSVEKAAVIGALRLYLDFINLFLFLLRILGGGGRR
jgi:FtsH-binding integral membrane protein